MPPEVATIFIDTPFEEAITVEEECVTKGIDQENRHHRVVWTLRHLEPLTLCS